MIDRAVWWVIALVAALAVAGCGTKHESFRYRLTVEVETPQGLRSGSSVIEVDVSQTGENAWATPEARGLRFKIRGEAVAVDLPNGQVLFALLSGEDSPQRAAGLPYATLQPPRFEGEFDYIKRTRALERTDRLGVVPRSAYPMLVTFGDLSDPASVELVDPDDLAASFGEGVRLKRLTVQMTDDPVTTGTQKRLAWLAEHGRNHARLKPSGSRYLDEAEPINLVTPGDFSTELYKTE